MIEEIAEKIEKLKQVICTKREEVRLAVISNDDNDWKGAEIKMRELILLRERVDCLKSLMYHKPSKSKKK